MLAVKAGIPPPYRVELGRQKSAQLEVELDALLGLGAVKASVEHYGDVTLGGVPVTLNHHVPGIAVGEAKS